METNPGAFAAGKDGNCGGGGGRRSSEAGAARLAGNARRKRMEVGRGRAGRERERSGSDDIIVATANGGREERLV